MLGLADQQELIYISFVRTHDVDRKNLIDRFDDDNINTCDFL